MSRSMSLLQPLRSAIRQPSTSRQVYRAVPSLRIASRSYSTETESAKSEAKPEPNAPTPADAEKAAALEAKVKELERDLMYNRAEVQTMSRRVGEERTKASEFAISKFALSLLNTTDTLTIALNSVPKPLDENNKPLVQLYTGIEMTQRALLKTFGEHKVSRFEKTVGEAFDPNLHEAIFQIPKEVAPPKSDGTQWDAGVVFEVQKEGWMIGPRVLRPAQVGVTQLE